MQELTSKKINSNVIMEINMLGLDYTPPYIDLRFRLNYSPKTYSCNL